MSRQHVFPFEGLVGQERMKTALLLNAVDPGIGGVLISGHKGTGKSTAVRALANILPRLSVIKGCPYHCSPDDEVGLCLDCTQKKERQERLETEQIPMPLVELPLSATEDRVVGTLHVETILKTGKKHFEPGLLASANRGILYVDEVNLLDDHLVDVLLDAAASGVNTVERESVSYAHPARFMLVGTMNPEEGELRPQFLDRFGLSVHIQGVGDSMHRAQIIRSRMNFDRDPEQFRSHYKVAEDLLANQISNARADLEDISIPPEMIDSAVGIAMKFEVQGHRTDIAIIKAARALAGLMDRDQVSIDHISEAARFVLPHRIADLSLSSPQLISERIDQVIAGLLEDQTPVESSPLDQEITDSWDDIEETVPGANAASHVDLLFTYLEEKKKLSMNLMNSSASKN
ncbi:MAG: hypothetical protein D6B25_16235 [Desulfobulbaceae bacterium]|nr:MAG: hypothetical protein D6B25_16235 [Desulfobulbaceae bacterium]